MTLTRAIDEFFAFSFGIIKRPQPGELLFSHRGWYLERHPGKLIFLDIDGGGLALSGEAFLAPYQKVGLACFRERLEGVKPEFDDTDRFATFLPEAPISAVPLGPEHAHLLVEMYERCSISEQENVEVELGSDKAWGVFRAGALVGFARYYPLPPNGRIVDLGVIVRPDHRGKGIARGLTLVAAQHALGQGLYPRYRTNAENLPTIAVAEALGFRPAYRLRVFGSTGWDHLARQSGTL